jgi:lipoprotein-anchoring transpeptidase ErfK/SrfK
MARFAVLMLVLALTTDADARVPKRKKAPAFDPALVNDAAAASLPVTQGKRGPAVLRAQVLLDRAGFSPGEIDGACGRNLRLAIAAFQQARGLDPSGSLDGPGWEALNADTAPVLMQYTLTEADVAGPFADVPEDMVEKSRLPALNYSSALEAVAEKFHVSPRLLELMNPGKAFDKAGETVWVPNTMTAPVAAKAARIVVDKSDGTVAALDAAGKTLAQYPATIGSEHDPLPIGTWKITGVRRNPVFHYNPKLFWDADPRHSKAKIAAGPNNPAGLVWIDLSKEHYGIHGTPEPGTVGHTQSHGCIRLTNWDAVELADMVKPGVPAILQE